MAAQGTKSEAADLRQSFRSAPEAAVRGSLIEPRESTRSGRSPALLDNLVGAHQHRVRHSEAERLGGLEVDDQLEGRRLLDRQIGGLGAFEDRSRVSADQAKGRSEACSIADQAAGSGEFTPRKIDGTAWRDANATSCSVSAR